MRLAESEKIKELLNGNHGVNLSNFAYVINLGSGNVGQTLQRKPWIERNVFQPMRALNLRIINVDLFAFPGVDIVADFASPQALDFLDGIPNPKLIILANVLEHIPAKTRENIMALLDEKMRPGDALLITAPLAYPYHPDPIDTLYRPSPRDLQRTIPLKWIAAVEIECGSFGSDLKGMSTLKAIRKLLKPFFPIMAPKKYLSAVHHLCYLSRPYVISAVLGHR